MTDIASMKTKLDQLCEKLMEDAQADGVTLSDKLEVFKICSQHYVNVAKIKGGGTEPPGSPGSTTTMGQLRERVANGASAQKQGDTDDETDAHPE